MASHERFRSRSVEPGFLGFSHEHFSRNSKPKRHHAEHLHAVPTSVSPVGNYKQSKPGTSSWNKTDGKSVYTNRGHFHHGTNLLNQHSMGTSGCKGDRLPPLDPTKVPVAVLQDQYARTKVTTANTNHYMSHTQKGQINMFNTTKPRENNKTAKTVDPNHGKTAYQEIFGEDLKYKSLDDLEDEDEDEDDVFDDPIRFVNSIRRPEEPLVKPFRRSYSDSAIPPPSARNYTATKSGERVKPISKSEMLRRINEAFPSPRPSDVKPSRYRLGTAANTIGGLRNTYVPQDILAPRWALR